MSRRSSRIEERRRTTGVDIYDAITQQLGIQETLDGEPKADEDDDSTSSDEDTQDHRPIKRLKRSEEAGKEEKLQRVRGKRGILQKIKEMPLDILFEVFSHLEPLDILQLSRTSYELRDLLMHRSSASVWRAARSNVVGLPPLPFDLDEPQYANLAFDSYCHVCMQPRCDTILWQFRIRCCRNCLTTALFTVSELVDVWKTTYARTFSVFELVKDYVPYLSVAPYWRGPWRGEDRAYYPPVVRKFRREFKRVKKDKEKLDAWVEEKKEQYKLLMEHVEQCTQWRILRNKERRAELEQVRRRRKDEIVKRLGDLGWADELEHVPDALFSRHKLVYEAEDLTERSWKMISDPLIAYLAAHKQTRLENEKAITPAVRPPS